MNRYWINATCRTSGGNLGQCCFALVAEDSRMALQLAARRVSIRGRSKINIRATTEA